jgi:phosphoribosylanthranilate isomerase
MLRVKICGLTNLADAQAAILAGADMLGFNFYPPSPRYLTPEACAEILIGVGQQLSGIVTVGVFVNTPTKTILTILRHTGLDLAQLSGDEPTTDLEEIGPARTFKALRTQVGKPLIDLVKTLPRRADSPACLVDAGVPGQYGGTGKVADWAQARELAQKIPVLLAGGLKPTNVAEAVRKVRPWGVDVASGVESAPGIKDPAKMDAFIKAARLMDNRMTHINASYNHR